MVLLENVLKISLQDVLKMSWRRLENVLKTSWRRLEEILKMFWRRLEDVLKTSWRSFGETSWRYLEDVFWRRKARANIFRANIWSRRLEDVLKTSSEDKDKRHLQDVFKTSSSRRMFVGKSAKHEKLGKYWSYCTRNLAITNVYQLHFRTDNSPNFWLSYLADKILIGLVRSRTLTWY